MKLSRRRFSQLSLAAAGMAPLRPAFAQSDPADVVRAHGTSLVGALKYPAGFAHFDYVNPDAPAGGRVTLATSTKFDSFNPFIVKGDSPSGIGLIFDTLMSSTLDEGSTMYGQLAEWIEHPKDFGWVAFRLREGPRWHDGEPITPDDVIWTFRTLTEKGAPFYRYYYQNVDKVTDEGDRVVRFHFTETGNRELPHIMGQLAVLPMHWWASRTFEDSSLEPMLGSGPYRIGKFEPGRFIEYERVPDYWGADIPVNVGSNNFDVIRYETFLDATAGLEAFKAGVVDFRAENSAINWATAYDFPAVKRGDVVKREVHEEGPKVVQCFAFNLRRPKFQDVRTRKALSLAFDFEWTNKTIYFNQYARPRSYFQGTDDLMPQGEPEGRELELLEPFRGQVPDDVFGPAYVPPKTDGSGRNRRNLREAARLLREAGWRVQDGKLVDAAGEPFRIRFLISQAGAAQTRILDPLMRNYQTLGIDAEVEERDTAQYIQRVFQSADFDFDMIINSVSNSESPGNEQRDLWGSSSADNPGTRNVSGVKDPAVDGLIDKIIFAENRDDLTAASRALDRVLTHLHVSTLQLYTPFERIAYWDKFGYPDPLPPRSYGFPSVWWWDADKVAKLKKG